MLGNQLYLQTEKTSITVIMLPKDHIHDFHALNKSFYSYL